MKHPIGGGKKKDGATTLSQLLGIDVDVDGDRWMRLSSHVPLDVVDTRPGLEIKIFGRVMDRTGGLSFSRDLKLSLLPPYQMCTCNKAPVSSNRL